ncbi:SDR family NAD(P)-dependent oxidoreductase [Motiliproteus sp. MSK22-1]|uniref:SDR family NAD(P)-dependent oxidoreductase n=1 Tax=Motiliproteus sp. MSK22-1 TaxID=1897630 RepID=UPI0009765402|nr:SDR family NAD(P)-dependent oxidoreductase [Motiliproteus sp. MSK22-1]OMH37963.1 short-chain dehydrogenase [Motiliproteus sp. MSK22-1]
MNNNKVVIVTGGTHGIGASIVERLSKDGKTVVFTGRDKSAGAKLQAAIIHSKFVQADASNAEELESVVRVAAELGAGKICGLVNNAGTTSRTSFADTTIEEWDRVFGINTRAVFKLINCALPYLIKGEGAVVNMSSIAGKVGEEGLATYCASKAAVIGLTQALALEYGEQVRFNAICPGQIETRMMSGVINNEPHLSALTQRIPAARLGQPQEVAKAAAWLLSDNASFVNGAVLSVDGGESAGYRTPYRSTT